MVSLEQADSWSWPSTRTNSYLLNIQKISKLKRDIINTSDLGKHYPKFTYEGGVIKSCDFNYGLQLFPEFLINLRTARDLDNTLMSEDYCFERLGYPIAIHLRVNVPWLSLLTKKIDEYHVHAQIRSPEKNNLPLIKEDLEELMDKVVKDRNLILAHIL